MDNYIIIDAEIILNDAANKWIASFPVKENFRTSFWFIGDNRTYPCEINCTEKISNVGSNYKVQIMLPLEANTETKMSLNSEFHFGVKNDPIGKGYILNIR